MTTHTYTLIMLNAQGASEQTIDIYSKAQVRRTIRQWDAKSMTARVYVDSDSAPIYDGPALGF